MAKSENVFYMFYFLWPHGLPGMMMLASALISTATGSTSSDIAVSGFWSMYFASENRRRRSFLLSNMIMSEGDI